LALLAILPDTTTRTGSPFEKFGSSQNAVAGWPLVEQAAQASALWWAGRFQVEVIGQGDGLASGAPLSCSKASVHCPWPAQPQPSRPSLPVKALPLLRPAAIWIRPCSGS